MHPPLQRKTILHTNAWHIAGRFASGYFPVEILQELTKVNKLPTISLEPISCKGVTLLSVKPGSCNLQVWLTKWPLISAVPFTYHPNNPTLFKMFGTAS